MIVDGVVKGPCAVLSPRRYMLSRDKSGFEGCCCRGMTGSMGDRGPMLPGIEG
jgi:hypothetical protein